MHYFALTLMLSRFVCLFVILADLSFASPLLPFLQLCVILSENSLDMPLRALYFSAENQLVKKKQFVNIFTDIK